MYENLKPWNNTWWQYHWFSIAFSMKKWYFPGSITKAKERLILMLFLWNQKMRFWRLSGPPQVPGVAFPDSPHRDLSDGEVSAKSDMTSTIFRKFENPCKKNTIFGSKFGAIFLTKSWSKIESDPWPILCPRASSKWAVRLF